MVIQPKTGKVRAAIITLVGVIISTVGVIVTHLWPNSSPTLNKSTPSISQLAESFPFSGKVVDKRTEKGISQATIEAFVDQKAAERLTSDSSGTFHMYLPNETKSLRLSSHADGFTEDTRDVQPRRTGPEIVELSPQSPPASSFRGDSPEHPFRRESSHRSRKSMSSRSAVDSLIVDSGHNNTWTGNHVIGVQNNAGSSVVTPKPQAPESESHSERNVHSDADVVPQSSAHLPQQSLYPDSRSTVPGERALRPEEQQLAAELHSEYLVMHPNEPLASIRMTDWINQQIALRGHNFWIIPKPYGGQAGIYGLPGSGNTIMRNNIICNVTGPAILNQSDNMTVNDNTVIGKSDQCSKNFDVHNYTRD